MISMKATYAIQALVCIASRPLDTVFVAWKIAQVENIPQKFLEEILLDLRKEGILRSKTGKCGGYYLQRTPEEVRLKDILGAINDPLATNLRFLANDRGAGQPVDLIASILLRIT